MRKYFKLSNLLLGILVLILIYLGYSKIFNLEKTNKDSLEKDTSVFSQKKDKNSSVDRFSQSSDFSSSNKAELQEKKVNIPTPELEKKEENFEKIMAPEEESDPSQGVYNNSTYSFQVKFPKNWPLRIRSKEKISLGYTIPEKGRGAVTIEVIREAGEAKKEIEEAKQEAQKYPGMIKIEEEIIFVDGVKGRKYIIKETVSGEKDLYILLTNFGREYLIKYPGAGESINSEVFLEEVEYVLDNFKFISS